MVELFSSTIAISARLAHRYEDVMLQNFLYDLKFWLTPKGFLVDIKIPKSYLFDDYIIEYMPGVDTEYNDCTIRDIRQWCNQNLSGPYKINAYYSHIQLLVARPTDVVLLKLSEPLDDYKV